MKQTLRQLEYASPGITPRAPRCPPGAGETWLQVLLTLLGVIVLFGALVALFVAHLDLS